jgi:hypothetical protein
VGYGQPTFDRLIAAEPETLTSSFAVSHSMLLNVIARPGDCYAAMKHLLTDNDEPRERQRRHVSRAIAAYRALLTAEVVEPLDVPDAVGRTARLTVDLQADFALNQPLSTFALAAIGLLDPVSPTYALDVVSVIESTLENPRPVLSAQQFAARGEAVAAMKADGVEYEERMQLLEDVTHPQPLADLLHAAYETYRGGHPWVADYELRPKSIARDLSERSMTFVEYISFYNLARSEGLVLRYLADAYKALRQTVPEEARTEELGDLTVWLGELVRQVDSSLLDEWEQLRHPTDPAPAVIELAAEVRPPPVTANERAFRVLVRNAMFRRVELSARRQYDELGGLDGESGWDAEAWESALDPYFAAHGSLSTGANARGPKLLMIDAQPDRWLVRQIFDDPERNHDWGISAEIDLAASDDAGVAVVTVTAVDEL